MSRLVKKLSGIKTAQGTPLESLPGWDAKRGVFVLDGTRPRSSKQSGVNKYTVGSKAKPSTSRIRRSA